MIQSILLPLDGSPLAEHALPFAISIAKKSQASLHLALVHVVDLRGPQFEIESSRAERTYLDQTAARVRKASGLSVTAKIVEEGPVVLGLCDYADTIHADLVVLTTHGSGPMSRFWLGSVADELLRTARIPVLVNRPPAKAPLSLNSEFQPRRILVPLDGSAVAEAAINPAAELARLFGAGLSLLRAVEPVLYLGETPVDRFYTVLTKEAQTDLDGTAAKLSERGLELDTKVYSGQPAAVAILSAAESADLIVIASHGRGLIGRYFLGSVSDKVVRGAACPVLVVRSALPTGGM